jgi:hypothetical protein
MSVELLVFVTSGLQQFSSLTVVHKKSENTFISAIFCVYLSLLMFHWHECLVLSHSPSYSFEWLFSHGSFVVYIFDDNCLLMLFMRVKKINYFSPFNLWKIILFINIAINYKYPLPRDIKNQTWSIKIDLLTWLYTNFFPIQVSCRSKIKELIR